LKKNDNLKLLLDLKDQPISNRYLENPNQTEELFPLKLGQCQDTGLIQLIDPVSYEELVPRFDWVSYREPEDHLDEMVEKLDKILQDTHSKAIGGVSSKDDSMLDRFSRKGYETWRIDPQKDLALDSFAGVESIQALLDYSTARQISERYGKVDLLVLRHIWEHVYDQGQFAEALNGLISEEGYILFEVPDCTNFLKSFDCTMIWEEHLYYYTPETITSALEQHGFKIVDISVFPYLGENALTVLVKRGRTGGGSVDQLGRNTAMTEGVDYCRGLIKRKQFIKCFLEKEKKKGNIAIYGAGHLSCAFISYLELDTSINYMIDDNLNKQGLFMPKSKIPIVSSEWLSHNQVSTVLLAVNPMWDKEVISGLRKIVQKTTHIGSIFPGSEYFSFYDPTLSL
jgi:hypothetical protein